MNGLWARLNTKWGRRIGIAVGVTLVLYSLLGFVGVPQALYYAAKELGTRTGASVQLSRAAFNPFTLRLQLEGFDLRFADEPPILAFDRLVVDFDGTSIVRGAYVFEALELVNGASNLVREPSGQTNVQRFLDALATDDGATKAAENAPTEAPAPKDAPPPAPPAIVVRSLAIVDAQVRFRDETRAPAFATAALPITLRLEEFSTLADQASPFSFSATTQDGARISWSGNIGVFPLASTGELSIERLDLTHYQPLVAGLIRGQLKTGQLGVSGRYRVLQRGRQIDVEWNDGALTLDRLALGDPKAKADAEPPLAIGRVRAGDIRFDLADRTLELGRVLVADGQIRARRTAEGTIDLATLFRPPARPAGTTKTSTRARATTATSTRPPDNPWRIRVAEVALEQIDMRGEQATPTGPIRMGLDGLAIRVRDVKIPELSAMPIRLQTAVVPGGRITATATVAVKPSLSARARVDISGVDFTPLEPLVRSRATLDLDSGRLTVKGDVRYPESKESKDRPLFAGMVRIDDLNTKELRGGRRLAGLGALQVSGLEVSTAPVVVAADRIDITKPYARVTINRDQTTNLQAVFTAPPPAKTSSPPKPPPPPTGEAVAAKTKSKAASPQIRIQRIQVKNGAADFADFAITPSFSAGIQRLNGSVTNLVTGSRRPGRLRLRGRVDGYSPVSISGLLRPFDPRSSSQFRLKFDNVEMTSFSAYSAKFVGYRLKKGKLSVELGYRFTGSKLQGDNRVIVDLLELGESVDSPDAISVPFKLAIALLEDRNGRIDLELPVSGDMKDPQFSFGGIIWSTFVNVLTKVALAPFDMVASLFGGGEELDTIEFPPGLAQLPDDGFKKVQSIRRALTERGRLKLEIEGRYDRDDDGLAVARQQLDAILEVLAASLKGDSTRAQALTTRLKIPDRPPPGAEATLQLPGAEDPTLSPDADADAPGPTFDDRDALVREAYRRVFERPENTPGSSTAALAEQVQVPGPERRSSDDDDDDDDDAPEPDSLAAPIKQLEGRFLERLTPSEQTLFALARRRARAIKDIVLEDDQIESGRVFTLDVSAADEPTVHLNLNVD